MIYETIPRQCSVENNAHKYAKQVQESLENNAEKVRETIRLPHVVAYDKSLCQSFAHSGVVHCHEDRVDDDTKCDEEIDEGVHDE